MNYWVTIHHGKDTGVAIDDLDEVPEKYKRAVELLNAMDATTPCDGFFHDELPGVGMVERSGTRKLTAAHDKAFYIFEEFLTLESEESNVG